MPRCRHGPGGNTGPFFVWQLPQTLASVSVRPTRSVDAPGTHQVEILYFLHRRIVVMVPPPNNKLQRTRGVARREGLPKMRFWRSAFWTRTDLPDRSVNTRERFDAILQLGHYQIEALTETGSPLFRAFAAIVYRKFAALIKS